MMLCMLGFVVRGRLLAAGARGAALRDRHQGGQGPRHLTRGARLARPRSARLRRRPALGKPH